ncbi:MAG TPA: hypothetical protein VH331_01630 [Allosphingosinicella sp.]|jgi:hypothetical protein|nr:hypothetical protein [Allosphingosinicella sp.]
MWLEQSARLASIVSALAIVVSVVYAAIQIRRNTRAVSASAYQQVVNSFAQISFEIAADRDLVDLVLRAGRDFGALDEVERARYSLMLLSFLRRAENVLFQSTTAHVLSDAHWSGIRNSIAAILAPPGARLCWREIETRLNPEFRAFVETLLAEPAGAS